MPRSAHPTRCETVNKLLTVERNAWHMRFAKNISGQRLTRFGFLAGRRCWPTGRLYFCVALRSVSLLISTFNSGAGVVFLNFRILRFGRICRIGRRLYPDADASILRWTLTKQERDEYESLAVLENQRLGRGRRRLPEKAGAWPERGPDRNFGLDFGPGICPF